MAKKAATCQLVVRSTEGGVDIYPLNQRGWHDALSKASDTARRAQQGHAKVAHVDVRCGTTKVTAYGCRREAFAVRGESSHGIPALVHCELDVSQGLGGSRKRKG